MTECVTLFVTVESDDVAAHMATALVKERFVACANISSGVRSIYEWDGLIQFDQEVILHLKTTTENVDKTLKYIQKNHSYDIPCITVSPIIGGNPDYLAWIAQQVSERT